MDQRKRCSTSKQKTPEVVLKAQQWQDHNRELFDFLTRISDGNQFAADFLSSITLYGSPSPGQLNRAARLKAQHDAQAIQASHRPG